MCTHLGCAQLIALPLFVLALPFQILRMVISLLPLVIKYAPLALLFVKNDGSDPDSKIDAVIYKYRLGQSVNIVEVCSLPGSITCYKIALYDNAAKSVEIAGAFEELLAEDSETRLFVGSNDLNNNDAAKSFDIWQFMHVNDIKIGYDSRLAIVGNNAYIDSQNIRKT